MKYAELAESLTGQLKLQHPPIAVAFVQQQPAGVSRTAAVVPSGCAFWRRAESDVFYAAAEDHFNCPLGAMVLGFALPAKQMEELQQGVKMMCGISYVREEEVTRVPKMSSESAGIVYGPLQRFPIEPDAVLLWVTPEQGMVMSECCGLINWAGNPAGMLGRPGCASIPTALAGARAAQSFGCTGMRLHTSIPGELFLMVLPRNLLANLTADLNRTCSVQAQMAAHYRARAAQLSAA